MNAWDSRCKGDPNPSGKIRKALTLCCWCALFAACFARGPGIKAGQVLQTPTAHEDILPTILNLAGIELPADLDGQPLPLPITPSAGYKQPESKFEQ